MGKKWLSERHPPLGDSRGRKYGRFFGVEILEIIEASQGIKIRNGSVSKVGALGVPKNLLKGVFNYDSPECHTKA